MKFGWISYGCFVATLAVTGCAEPCADDGFGQQECPADSAGTDSGSDSATFTTGPSGTATQPGTTAATQDSDSESESGRDTEATATNSASTTGTTTGVSATMTDGSTTSFTTTTDGSTTSFTTTTDGSTSVGTDATSSGPGSTGSTSTAGSTSTGGATELYCVDADNDGFGDPRQCMQVDPDDPPPGTVPADAGFDCDDSNPQTFPGAAPLDDPDACMNDDDGDDYGDMQPGPGIVPGSDCDDEDPTVQACALLVTQDGTTNIAYDEQLIDSLQAAGLGVTVLADTEAQAADAAVVSLVVISETAESGDVLGEFRDVARPVIVLEGLIWDDMDMAPQGNAVSTDLVAIVDPVHPLAGGLVGVHDVIDGTSAGLFHTNPTGAAEVGTRPGNFNQVVLFGFEAGATMENGFAAPARRVGFGLDTDQNVSLGATLTETGQTLFEAAVAWALQ